jgi:hypothetical protein
MKTLLTSTDPLGFCGTLIAIQSELSSLRVLFYGK